MKKLRGIGTAGLTLVELIISMAILAVVGVAIGGAMYVSSRSYTRGASEVNVQEEAQVASNLICDWIVDAISVNPDPTDATGKTYLNQECDYLEIVHPEGDRLVKVTIRMGTAPGETDKLKYTAIDITDPSDPDYGSEVGSGVLASNVTGCFFYTTFGVDRNVKISLDFNVNDRTYRAVTDTSSRSHDFISTGGTSTVQAPVIRFGLVSNVGGPHVTLEPGQRSDVSQYVFDVYVDNCDPDTLIGGGINITAPGSASTQIVSCNRVPDTNQWQVTVRSNDNATGPDSYVFTASNMAGSDSKTLQVKIRRVQDCSFATFETKSGKHYMVLDSGTKGKMNAVYQSVINLNAINYEQETNIIGAQSMVYGKEGFDAAPWYYYDPTELEVSFMSWDESQGKWVSRSSDATATWTPGANPVLQVKLLHDIDKPIAVVVCANRSGSIAGSNVASDPHCGASIASENRATVMDHRTGFGYGPSGEAYYDVAWIAPGDGYDPFDEVGTGFRRGTPACMLALYGPDFENKMIQLVMKETKDTEEHVKTGVYTYKTVLYYKPKTITLADGTRVANTSGTFESFFMYSDSNLNAMTQEASRRIRYDVASLFKLDTAYDIYLEFQVWKGNYQYEDLTFRSAGSVPAATPYVYNPATSKFRETDSKSEQISLPKGDHQQISIYFEGCCFNGNEMYHDPEKPYINCYVEQYDAATDKWVKVDNKVKQIAWTEGSDRCPTHTITFEDPDDKRSLPVGGYVENEHNYKNENLQLVFVDTNSLSTGGNYRLHFDTYYKEMQNVNPTLGTATNPQSVHYDFKENFVYFTVK